MSEGTRFEASRNTVAATTTRISLGADGAQSKNLSDNPSIAADGKTIAFHSGKETILTKLYDWRLA